MSEATKVADEGQAGVGSSMLAAVLHSKRVLQVDRIPTPVPARDEVLVRIRSCGICASDIHYLAHGRIGDWVVDRPMILGHEASGDVVAAGEAVPSDLIGARVALEPGASCGRCEACKSGAYNLCPDVRFFATPPVDGAMAEYAVIRADLAHRIPDSVSYDAGALVEPLAVGVYSARLTGVGPGDTVVILGAGPIGLCALLACRQAGARNVLVSDPMPNRLAVASRLGAAAVVNPLEDDIATALAGISPGRGADALLDTAGNRAAAETAPELMRRGGSIAVIGLPPDDRITYRMNVVASRQLSIHGVFRYANAYPAAISLAAGLRSVDDVVTHRFPLREAVSAFEMAETAKDRCIKVIVQP
jgi:L-iditol 2-dehydrogenase